MKKQVCKCNKEIPKLAAMTYFGINKCFKCRIYLISPLKTELWWDTNVEANGNGSFDFNVISVTMARGGRGDARGTPVELACEVAFGRFRVVERTGSFQRLRSFTRLPRHLLSEH